MMDLSRLSPRERLAAEQAVLLQRELDRVAEDAPHGHGLACLESVVTDAGFAFLRQRLSDTVGARDEAQKKGAVSGRVRAAGGGSSRRPTRGVS